jgi:hypothetical protein
MLLGVAINDVQEIVKVFHPLQMASKIIYIYSADPLIYERSNLFLLSSVLICYYIDYIPIFQSSNRMDKKIYFFHVFHTQLSANNFAYPNRFSTNYFCIFFCVITGKTFQSDCNRKFFTIFRVILINISLIN